MRRERPRGRAADKRDELASFHSITSSASASSLSGDFETECFGGRQIDNEFVLGRLLDGNITWLR
jgi:hypothetical protein